MTKPLDVSDALRNPGRVYPFSAEISLPEIEVSGDLVRFAPIALTGTFMGAGETISIRADFACIAIMPCARCLSDVRVPLDLSLDERFARVPDAQDPDIYAFAGSNIDLDACVLSAVVLALPMRVVCSEDCAGLCPVCGANRNLVSCTCLEGGAVASPFSALMTMVENDEEV